MKRSAIHLTLLALALLLPLAAHADTIDDFVLIGNGNTITFSLPASPQGNHSTCPTSGPISCLPGSQTAFYLSTPVVINGVSEQGSLAFPTGRFGGGLSLSPIPGALVGQQLFTPDAEFPTFLLGTFTLGARFPTGDPLSSIYTLTITEEPTVAATPEPSTLALFTTGALGFLGFTRSRFKLR